MKMPSSLSTWFMILFFLFAGIFYFAPSFGGAFWGYLTGIFALGAAVTLFLGK